MSANNGVDIGWVGSEIPDTINLIFLTREHKDGGLNRVRGTFVYLHQALAALPEGNACLEAGRTYEHGSFIYRIVHRAFDARKDG